MTDPYRTPSGPKLPSIFDVKDGDVIRDAYAVPGTPFTLRMERVLLGSIELTVCRDGEPDDAVSQAMRRRFYGSTTDPSTFCELGRALADIARAEAR